MSITQKQCVKCSNTFEKKCNYTIDYWKNRIFCSISCGKKGRKPSLRENEKRSKSLRLFYSKPESKKMLSDIRKKQWQNGFKGSTGKHWKKTLDQLLMGTKNPAWKGGITPINAKIRNSQEYADWRTKVFERDNYACRECGSRGITLHADHIKPFAYFPELRLVTENGRTLCVPCHRRTDTFAGRAIKGLELASA